MVSSESSILEFFCRHLVGIAWYEGVLNDDGEFAGTPTFCGASGFMLQLHDELPGAWGLITAGHVFTDYKERLSKPRMGAKHHSLFDIWGPASRCDERIPFNLFEYPSSARFDRDAGIDIAVVPLPPYVLRLISQTIVPFTKTNWIHQPNVQFECYAMLGLPNESARQVAGQKNGREFVSTFQSPVLLFVNPCELPPKIAPATNRQFVAKIDPHADLDSIRGMSGGPILGFRRNPQGQFQYWPVAIQSRWLPESRIVIGTLLPLVAAWIEKQMEAFLRRHPS
jgi:hypothetical protein